MRAVGSAVDSAVQSSDDQIGGLDMTAATLLAVRPYNAPGSFTDTPPDGTILTLALLVGGGGGKAASQSRVGGAAAGVMEFFRPNGPIPVYVALGGLTQTVDAGPGGTTTVQTSDRLISAQGGTGGNSGGLGTPGLAESCVGQFRFSGSPTGTAVAGDGGGAPPTGPASALGGNAGGPIGSASQLGNPNDTANYKQVRGAGGSIYAADGGSGGVVLYHFGAPR